MWSWIVIIVLYLLGMGFFALIGGVAGAADALAEWGSQERVRTRPPLVHELAQLAGGRSPSG